MARARLRAFLQAQRVGFAGASTVKGAGLLDGSRPHERDEAPLPATRTGCDFIFGGASIPTPAARS